MKNKGFTLMEVLVAVVIVGLTVGVFFQLISSSMRLSIRSRDLLETSLAARDFFELILDKDVREDDFEFEGQLGIHPWELRIFPIDIQKDVDVDDGLNIKLPAELYESELTFYYSERRKKFIRLSSYQEYKTGYFSDDFKDKHLSEREQKDSDLEVE